MTHELAVLLQSFETALWNEALQEGNEGVSDCTLFKLMGIKREKKEALVKAIERLEERIEYLEEKCAKHDL